MNLSKIILLVFVLGSLSCKKKAKPINETVEVESPQPVVSSKYDTIKPLSYFPAFPGSYWKYLNSNNDTVTYTVSPTYKKDCYVTYSSSFPGVIASVSDTVLVPYYMNIPVWGYKLHVADGSFPGYPAFTEIVSESSSQWSIYKRMHEDTYEEVTERDASVLINGHTYSPTIIITRYRNYQTVSSNHNTAPISRRYHTKDIGIVKTETLTGDQYSPTVTGTENIVSYHINH